MIRSLTSLRGIFILFIFFHHCLGLYPGGGTLAVAFFFVLGGFSLTLGYKERILQPEFNYRQYLYRRCLKFYPLHWICLLAMIPLIGLPLTLKQGVVLLTNASLMQTIVPLRGLYFSYNAPSWYLANTILFAVIFPPLAKFLLHSSRIGIIGIIAAYTIAYVLLVLLIPLEWYHNLLYISPFVRLGDFILGIFLALVFLDEDMPKRLSFLNNCTICSILGVIFIVLLVLESCLLDEPANLVAPVYWPLIAVLILTTSFIDEKPSLLHNKVFHRIGELSFIIFLTHNPILGYATRLFNWLQMDQPVLYVILTLLLTIAVSIVLERYILKPITKWLTRSSLVSTTVQS